MLVSFSHTYLFVNACKVVLDTCVLFCGLEPVLVPGDHCHYFGPRLAKAERLYQGDVPDPEPAPPANVSSLPTQAVPYWQPLVRRAALRQLRWLGQELAVRGSCTVVVGHVPVYSTLMCQLPFAAVFYSIPLLAVLSCVSCLSLPYFIQSLCWP